VGDAGRRRSARLGLLALSRKTRGLPDLVSWFRSQEIRVGGRRTLKPGCPARWGGSRGSEAVGLEWRSLGSDLRPNGFAGRRCRAAFFVGLGVP
jgi:hypothetical protein